MSKFIVGSASDRIYQALYDAGAVTNPPNEVRRVVIDLQVGSPARIYLDTFADDRLTNVLFEGGIKLVESEAA